MNMPHIEDAEAGRTLVQAAATLLAGRRGDIPHDFLLTLFERATPDDLVRYSPQELAEIGEQSWAFFQNRQAGAAKIAFRSVRAGTSTAVLEILNDDMPFLVDSVLAELSERAVDIRLLVHPVFTVERDAEGKLVAFRAAHKGDGNRESFIHIHVADADDEAERAAIVDALETVLGEVRIAVQDWRPMLARASEVAAELKANPPPLPADEIAEAIQFLQWIAADNFTLLGARDYTYTDTDTELVPTFETGLGILRSPDTRLLRRGNQLVTMTPEIRAFLKEPKLLIMTKAAIRSRIHRRVYLDYIGIKRFDAHGSLVGECVFCGLLTSTAYTRSVRAIPYLRRKVDQRHQPRRLRSGEPFGQGAGQCAGAISARRSVPDRRRHAVSVRHGDHAARRASASARAAAARPLRPLRVGPGLHPARPLRLRASGRRSAIISPAAFQGRLRAFYPFFPEGPMVRVHFIIGRYEGDTPQVDRATLESAVEAIVRSWTDALGDALTAAHPPREARTLLARYREAFPVDYREVYAAPLAISDIAVIETLTAARPLGVELYRDAAAGPAGAGLKVLSRSRPIPLSERVPVLENMGFRVVDERTYHIRAARNRRCVVPRHDAGQRVRHSRRSRCDTATACRIASWR